MDLENEKDEKASIEIPKIEDGINIHEAKRVSNNYGKYKIINKLYKTKNGELFLISDIENKRNEINVYILNKIEIKTKEKKIQIEEEINTLKNIDYKYVINIIDSFIIHEEEKDFMCIIMNYYKNDLSKIIYQTNYLNMRNIWKIFIQIIFGLNYLKLKNIIPKYLNPQNIYLDNENNIKIGGINMVSDTTREDIKELLYTSPEIINGEENDEKSNIWSVGCIIYELAFKKPVFEKEKLITNIYEIDCFPDECEKGLSRIILKLICEKSKRFSINDVILNGIFKSKIIEINLFSEIVKDDIQGK